MKKVIGIDLAGSEKRNSGFCVLDEKFNAKAFVLHTDAEILNTIKKIKAKPKVIAIDAPLCLPLGRKSLRKPKSKGIHFRKCDLELRKMKIKFFPITLGPMRKLTIRGIRLKKRLEKNYEVIEVFPGGAQDILGIPRKQDGIEGLLKGLKRQGVKNLHKKMNGDELDAVTCALVGMFYVNKKYLALGDPKEGLIIMPLKKTYRRG